MNPDPGNNANFYDRGYAIGGPYWVTETGEFENSESPYGTYDQGGNVYEWNEAIILSGLGGRGLRGGAYNSNANELHAGAREEDAHHTPGTESYYTGFRVASLIPEPTTCTLALAALCMVMGRRKRE